MIAEFKGEGEEREEITEDDVISWIETITVPKISKIERKEELATTMKENDYVVLGYTSSRGSSSISSMVNTVGELAKAIKSALKSKSTTEFNLQELYLAKSEFSLSTNSLIAQKFGLEDGVKDAIIIVFKDKDSNEDSKAFSVLAKRFGDENEPMKVESMIQTLQNLLFGKHKKDEL